MVPVLQTERLILRGHKLEDFPARAAMWSDPVFLRHLGPARTEEEAWIRFLCHEGMWRLIGYGLWAVEEKASGAYIGDAGFMRTRRGLPIDCGDLPEGGWTLIAVRPMARAMAAKPPRRRLPGPIDLSRRRALGV